MALQVLAGARQGTARADARDENIHFAVGVLPDFRARRRKVCGGIRGIHELPRNEGAGDGFREFFGFGNGALHTLGTFREDDFSTVGREQLAAFHAHRFGHREDRTVTAACGDACQPDPGIAARGFDDDGAWF